MVNSGITTPVTQYTWPALTNTTYRLPHFFYGGATDHNHKMLRGRARRVGGGGEIIEGDRSENEREAHRGRGGGE